jgi:D-arabinose 1-dehydrogenase-like Zn-dependent alcohol dehydrogenase
MFTKEGQWPGIQYPRVPGHEIAGIVDAVGSGVNIWQKGQRVGVGWYGGHCGECSACRRGWLIYCHKAKVTGISHDGGYAEYVVAPAQSVAALPGELSPKDAGPLLCAGVTTFNALRNSGAMPGDLVAIQAIGGLGHLGVQYGAHIYLDSEAVNVAEELQKMGGAKTIVSTAPSGKAMSALINGLGDYGHLMVVGASIDPIEVSPVQLIMGGKSIQGWASGVAADCEDALRFSVLTGVRPMIEEFPLEQAAKAYDRMMSGKAQFRVVLNVSN